MSDIISRLKAAAGDENVLLQEPMQKHTTFRIGGPADIFVTPDTIAKAAEVIRICKQEKMPYYVVGNGSNLLVSDQGYRGVIVQIYRSLNQIEVLKEQGMIRAQAGAMLSVIAKQALAQSLTGFEFASGIPGTIGGACVMNAGAYGGEMKHVLKEVTVLDENDEIKTIAADELELGYRHSVIPKRGWVVLEAVIQLADGDQAQIRARMEELKEQRTTKQPLEYPSAGSTFKRPEGYFAGKLIQDAGLRGFYVGDAQVAEKHCGFVINKGTATAADILALVTQVREKVLQDSGVTLEMEVKMLGDFS